jgi:hypothetical protein
VQDGRVVAGHDFAESNEFGVASSLDQWLLALFEANHI